MPDSPETENTSRKPAPQVKEPAQSVLNRFLNENNILIGVAPPKIEETNSGAILINAPKIVAVYGEVKNGAKPND